MKRLHAAHGATAPYYESLCPAAGCKGAQRTAAGCEGAQCIEANCKGAQRTTRSRLRYSQSRRRQPALKSAILCG